jgi:hypothetical protein
VRSCPRNGDRDATLGQLLLHSPSPFSRARSQATPLSSGSPPLLPIHSTLLYSTLLCSTLPHATLGHARPRRATPGHATQLHPTRPRIQRTLGHTDTRTHGHTDTRTHGHTDTRTHGHTASPTCHIIPPAYPPHFLPHWLSAHSAQEMPISIFSASPPSQSSVNHLPWTKARTMDHVNASLALTHSHWPMAYHSSSTTPDPSLPHSTLKLWSFSLAR